MINSRIVTTKFQLNQISHIKLFKIMSYINPSKGIECYVFIAEKGYSVKYESPEELGFDEANKFFVYDDGVSMQTNHIEIDKLDISLLKKAGRLEWKVYNKENDDSDNKIAGKYIEINPSTGNVSDTDIESTLHEDSIVNKSDNYSVSYGFYDASSGHFSELTNYDQSYVYVTKSLSNWMGGLVKSNSKYGKCAFNTFALAGSHDAGMYNNAEATNLVNAQEYTKFFSDIAEGKLIDWGFPLTDAAKENIKSYVDLFQKIIAKGGKNVVVNLAMTQKDNITTQLDLGIRFFDIRPGFCSYADSFNLPAKVEDAKGINNLYHQHNFVPGMSFDTILKEAMTWLDANGSEIIVMNLNFQAFCLESMKPTLDFLNEYLNKVVSDNNIKVKSGGKEDLSLTYNDLIDQNKRLIFLNQIGDAADATKYDSYNDTYKTTKSDVIIAALNSMSSEKQKGHDYTVLQLQGTANGIVSDIADSSATFSKMTSPLMSTKANFDAETYEWIYDNVPKTFINNQLMIFLNDFSDNALANQSFLITKSRMDK